MEPLVFWLLVAWSVAVGAMWVHAMWLCRRTQRDCRAVIDRLDREAALAHDERGAAEEG